MLEVGRVRRVVCACVSVFVRWEGWNASMRLLTYLVLAAIMWLSWEHRKVCETQHWRLSCKMMVTRILYVSVLCARANGRWKISVMSIHWVCVSVISHCQVVFAHLSDTETNHHTSWRALSFISVIRDIFVKYLSRSFLPYPSASSKWPLFTGPSSKIPCVLSSLPMQVTYVVVSYIVVYYLNCMYNTFELRCLKFSPVHAS